MLRHLTLSLIAVAGCSAAFAHEHTHGGATPAYSIDNPLRPGAKAPYCEAQTETADGCTFHSVGGASYDAHLAAGQGETWIATTSDAETIRFKAEHKTDVREGTSYQVIRIEPSPVKDADTTVTFDKLVGKDADSKVVERRRINVMVHPG